MAQTYLILPSIYTIRIEIALMKPRVEVLSQKRLVGINVKMSLINNRTGELWSRFMAKSNEIENILSKDKISMQVYPQYYFDNFNPELEFVKWATVEVNSFKGIPNDLEPYTLNGGLYAVFEYKGPGYDKSIFQYIYTTWVPNSKYKLDNRPHFEVLGEKYKNNDPDSEEEIWIPIQLK